MLKRYLISLSVIVLALAMGVLSIGCDDSEEAPPPQQPREWSPREQPEEEQPEEEQPKQPLAPREENNEQQPSGEEDSPAW